jgi:hypothetical protein
MQQIVCFLSASRFSVSTRFAADVYFFAKLRLTLRSSARLNEYILP